MLLASSSNTLRTDAIVEIRNTEETSNMQIRILMCAVLVALTALGLHAAGSVEGEATVIEKRHLPDHFPFQLLDQGFAIVEVRVSNTGNQALDFDASSVKVFEKKGKELEVALMTEMVPKLVKSYRGTRLGIHGEGRYGYPGYSRIPGRPGIVPGPTISPNPDVGSISVTLADELREKLEAQQLRSALIEPGTSVEGYVYLKSKKSGKKLLGGFVQVLDQTWPLQARD